MRPTARKILGTYRVNPETGVEEMPAVFYAMVMDLDRPVWICAHSHETRRKANACARGHIKRLPRTGPAALKLLRETWRPKAQDFPVEEDGRPRLSMSRVEAFLQCVQYQRSESPDGRFGSVIHDAIYAYWQLCLSTHEESRLGDVERLVTEAFFRTAGADPNRLQEAIDLVETFCSSRLLEAHKLLILDRQPVIEYTLRADNGWCWLVGKVDRIDRSDGGDPDDRPTVIRLRDYKTGWQAAGGRALDGLSRENGETRVVPHEFQRRFYAQLAFLDPVLGVDLEAVETEIDYIRYRGEPEVIVYERGELASWWEAICAGLLQRWQQREGPPTGCAACDYCSLRTSCAASLPEARNVPSTPEEAEVLAERWVRAKALVSSHRAALEPFFQGHASIQLGGLEVGFLRPHKPQWKPVRAKTLEIVQHLNLAGLNGEAASYPAGISADKIPANMKQPLVDAGLAKLEYGAPEFKSRKRGED